VVCSFLLPAFAASINIVVSLTCAATLYSTFPKADKVISGMRDYATLTNVIFYINADKLYLALCIF
jgi:hypothetical protein